MERIFDLVIQYGRKIRKQKANGLESWNKIKEILKPFEFTGCKWNIQWRISPYTFSSVDDMEDYRTYTLEEYYDFVHNSLGMKGDEEDEPNQTLQDWERFHFFLQLIRIPKNNECSLIRICQIAYNIGQLLESIGEDFYSMDSLNFFESNKLYKLDSFVICYNQPNKVIYKTMIGKQDGGR